MLKTLFSFISSMMGGDTNFDDPDIDIYDPFDINHPEWDGDQNDSMDSINTLHLPSLVKFGSTTEFPDGTQIDNPYTDAQGYVYKTKEDWINGTNKHQYE